MGTQERRQREKEQRLNDIKNAAERIFLTGKAFESITMDEIAKEAELSKGTLYLYFKTKEDLYFAVHLRAMDFMKIKLMENIKPELTGLEIIETIGKSYIDFSFDFPEYFVLMSQKKIFHSSDDLDENESLKCCINSGISILDFIAQSIKKGQLDGSIKKELDPKLTTTVIYGQLDGVLDHNYCNDEHILDFAECRCRDIATKSLEMALYSIKA